MHVAESALKRKGEAPLDLQAAQGAPTRKGGELVGVDRRQLQRQKRKECRSLDSSIERSPTRKRDEAKQRLTRKHCACKSTL
jgi:hypothetical protein